MAYLQLQTLFLLTRAWLSDTSESVFQRKLNHSRTDYSGSGNFAKSRTWAERRTGIVKYRVIKEVKEFRTKLDGRAFLWKPQREQL